MTKNKTSEEMYDKIFEDIDENMEMDIPYEWDQVATDFFILQFIQKKEVKRIDLVILVNVELTFEP